MSEANGNTAGGRVANGFKTGGIAGAIIAAVASLGYAEIQRRDNDILLQNNTILVKMVQSEAINCRDAMIRAYERGGRDERKIDAEADSTSSLRQRQRIPSGTGKEFLRGVDDERSADQAADRKHAKDQAARGDR